MSTLKLEIDTTDVLVMAVMGAALKTLAHERAIQSGEETPQHVEQTADTPAVREAVESAVANITPDGSHPAATTDETAAADETTAADTSETDSAGFPWDKRIHSSSKALNTDGTWKLQRKPKDMDREKWDGFVAAVKAELIAAISTTPPAPETVTTPPAPETVATTTPPAPETVATTTPPAPETVATPPAPETVATTTPPAPETIDAAAAGAAAAAAAAVSMFPDATPQVPDPAPETEYTFPDVMKFVTQNTAKITPEKVTAVVQKYGVTSIALLGQRSDLIQKVMVDLQALVASA